MRALGYVTGAAQILPTIRIAAQQPPASDRMISLVLSQCRLTLR